MSNHSSQADDIAKLHKMAREFTEGFNGGDVERIMRYYGDMYVDVNLRNPKQTKAERRKYYSYIIERGGFKINVHTDEVLIDGKYAFVRGTIEVTRGGAIPRETTRSELRYLEIVRKEDDGEWRVIWGMDGPVQEYVSEP